MKFFALFLLFISLLLTFNGNAAETTALKAPAWQLKTQAGENIGSAQYQNQPIILHFWATWCPYCKRLQPKLVELQKKYQSQGIKIVAISFDEEEGALPQDEINSRGYSFISAVQGEKIAKLYGVKGTPTTFFINRKNEVIYKTSSSNVNDPHFELAIKEIIKK
jgi:cytochrome c biogenesis protein CcmG, thiol:disulfide interchange protein DsbE